MPAAAGALFALFVVFFFLFAAFAVMGVFYLISGRGEIKYLIAALKGGRVGGKTIQINPTSA